MSTEGLRPAAVLFDLDGTLADSFAAIREALNTALRENGLPERELPWVRTHVGRGAVELLRDAVGADRDDSFTRAVGARFGAAYREIYLEQTPPMPEAGEVLALVARRTGGKVAVVSNKYEELCRGWLVHWGLAPHVAAVVGPDTFGVRKPDPATVLPVLEGFGVLPGDALMVGDMEIDVSTAKAAGIPAVAVHAEGAVAEALLAAGALAALDTLRKLPPWLARHGTGWR